MYGNNDSEFTLFLNNKEETKHPFSEFIKSKYYSNSSNFPFKDFKTNGKSERFLNTVNYMKNKYHFDIDIDKVNSIIKYMNIVSL
jgi:hypothetical protein